MMTIAILSLLDEALNIRLKEYSDYQFFASIFKVNDKGSILRVQTADDEFRTRLSIFDKIDKSSLKIKYFLNSIPDKSKFIVIAGPVNDVSVLSYFRAEIDNLNGLKSNLDIPLNKLKQTFPLYHIRCYNGNGVSQHIGESIRTKRVCRFCGKKIPDTSFKTVSHAISEFLGNKSIICREECDCCNGKFSTAIEEDVSTMLSYPLTLYSISGKKGTRKMKGKNFSLEVEKDDSNRENDKISLRYYKGFPDDIEHFLGHLPKLKTGNLKYVPQNVYKCFCKYVMSVINRDFLPHFQKTLEWISSPIKKHLKLPMIAVGSISPQYAPSLYVCMRKRDELNLPYCFAVLCVVDMAFAFIVPYSTKDRYTYTAAQHYQAFKQLVKSLFSGVAWLDFSFASSRKIPVRINFDLSVPAKPKLEQDYFVVSTIAKSNEDDPIES